MSYVTLHDTVYNVKKENAEFNIVCNALPVSLQHPTQDLYCDIM